MTEFRQENAADDRIDLKELLLALWSRRLRVCLSALAGLVLATAYAFLIAKPVYESSSLLIPTRQTRADKIGAAAALLGKADDGASDVALYQSLLSSRSVLRRLLVAPIENKSDSGCGKIEPLARIIGVNAVNQLENDRAIDVLAKSVIVGSKDGDGSGILEVKFSASTPWLAQQLGEKLLAIGQEEFRRVRIRRSEEILNRLDAAVKQAKQAWDHSAQKVSMYKERNRSISLPVQALELSRLEIEQAVQEQKYLLARKEYEALVLENITAAPPMMILDEADFPTTKKGQRKAVIIMVGMIAGALMYSAIFLGKNALIVPKSEC